MLIIELYAAVYFVCFPLLHYTYCGVFKNNNNNNNNNNNLLANILIIIIIIIIIIYLQIFCARHTLHMRIPS